MSYLYLVMAVLGLDRTPPLKKTPAEAGATPGRESGEIDRPVNTAR